MVRTVVGPVVWVFIPSDSGSPYNECPRVDDIFFIPSPYSSPVGAGS